jgi:HEAT repeat protein
MTASRAFRAAALACVLIAGASTQARADEATVRAAFEVLRAGCSPGRARAAIRSLAKEEPGVLAEAALRLAHAGGPAAAEGLPVLLGHTNAEVRLAALRTTAGMRLRSEPLRHGIQAALTGRSAAREERLTALEALGWVGDGRDVPALLDLCDDTDEETRQAAERAFLRLTGAVSPARSSARRRAWWAEVSPRAEAEVRTALDGLEGDPEGPDTSVHRQVLRAKGWMDVEQVRARLFAWLWQPDPALRLEAIRAAAALRLVDLHAPLADLARSPSRDSLAAAAREALVALGTATPATEEPRPAQR